MNNYLFNNENDSDNDLSFKTSKDYAKKYQKQRQKEVLQSLKDRNLADSDDEYSSESDTDTDEDIGIDTKFDKDFFKALAILKSKDPKIYNKNIQLFEENANNNDNKNKELNIVKSKEKPFTIKDYQRKVILEKGGVFEDEENEFNRDSENYRAQSPTFIEEEAALKKEFQKVLNKAIEEDDENEKNEKWGGFFNKREKSNDEQIKDEELYTKWLAGEEEANIGEDKKDLKSLKEYWSDPKLAKDEAFLRDYILNNGYIRAENEDQIPTYDEIVNSEEDDKDLELQEEFEYKYNYRYEEPDQEFIKRYPRTIESSVRKTDDKRKEKRLELKERKEREKNQRRQDLEMLKALKKQEIDEKIRQLKEVIGDSKKQFDDNDIDEDFDPDEHDKKMQEIFDNEYYQINEGDEKPECPDDLEDLQVEDWDNYDKNNDDDNDVNCDDPKFNMDCDYEAKSQTLEEEIKENLKGRKRRKRFSKFRELIRKDKPVFDPEDEKTYGEYIDEYYKLDYEDIIGDVKCRFRYVETVPNDFGLSVDEILLAKNKELNQWASLKKTQQLRPDYVEQNEVHIYKKRGANFDLKKKILQSVYNHENSEEENADAEEQHTVIATKQGNKLTNKKRKFSNSEENVDEKLNIIKKVKVIDCRADKFDEKLATNEATIVTAKKKSKKLKKKMENEMKTNMVPSNDGKQENKKKKLKNEAETTNSLADTPATGTGTYVKSLKSKQKEKLKSKMYKSREEITDSRLEAFGINPKKYRNKLKYGGGDVEHNSNSKVTTATETTKKKLKNKKKNVQKK